jgi:hypothetical protein
MAAIVRGGWISRFHIYSDIEQVGPHLNRLFRRLRVRSSIGDAGVRAAYRTGTFAEKLVARVTSSSQQGMQHLVPDEGTVKHRRTQENDLVAAGDPVTA